MSENKEKNIIVCPKCGKKNTWGDKYCMHCQHPLDDTVDESLNPKDDSPLDGQKKDSPLNEITDKEVDDLFKDVPDTEPDHQKPPPLPSPEKEEEEPEAEKPTSAVLYSVPSGEKNEDTPIDSEEESEESKVATAGYYIIIITLWSAIAVLGLLIAFNIWDK